jgi:hypothetical protein
MPFENNQIDISDLKNVTISVGDLRALVTVLDALAAPFVLPAEAMVAIDRLRKLIDRKG